MSVQIYPSGPRVAGLFLFGFLAVIGLFAAPVTPARSIPGFSLGLLWSGSWEHDFLKKNAWNSGGNLIDRGELRLNVLAPREREFTARVQVTDKRPLMPWEHPDEGNTALAGGLYHNATGSRLLYGILDEWGLPARLRNPWGKSAPFAENRRSSAADIKTVPSTRESETYLYLGSPRLGMFRGFASAQIDGALSPAFGGGLDLQFAKKTKAGFEVFYTGKHLPARNVSAWFSQKPPLPERDFALYGLNVFFNSPMIGLSADGACSETFALGQDFYGNLAFRLGSKPWQVSLAVDGAGSLFTDRGGANPGSGFRAAARFDWKGRRSSLFRGTLSLRTPSLGEPLEKISAALSYRFPSSSRIIPWNLPVQPANISLNAGRTAANTEKTLDSAELGLGFNLGLVKMKLNTAISGIIHGEADTEPAYGFNAAKVSAEASYYPGPLQFRTKLGYTITTKEPGWDISCYGAIRFKYGRLGLKIASPSLPGSWLYTLTWRLQGQRIFR